VSVFVSFKAFLSVKLKNGSQEELRVENKLLFQKHIGKKKCHEIQALCQVLTWLKA